MCGGKTSDLPVTSNRIWHYETCQHMRRDVSELLQEQIELYRVTKQNILQGLSEEAFTQMTPQARERALLQEMKSEGTLHPALLPHDKGPFTGHYKVTIPPASSSSIALMKQDSSAVPSQSLIEAGEHA